MDNQFQSLSPHPLTEAERLIMELERRAQALQEDQEQEPLVSLLTFYLSDEWFALPLEKIKVVTRIMDVTPVPGTSPFILGVINHKSAIYPLIDIHQLLKVMPPEPTRSSRFVILQHDKYTLAVLVDNMGEVREVKSSDLDKYVTNHRGTSIFISSELTIDNRLLGLLNLGAILNTVSEGEIQPQTRPKD
ncbi:MAG: chemotaxis protein CheW [Chloroflexi bacterium]|jgi:purine-binding chemotaxis protein CheW|nr:chemotaxis protein CheW [Chloroflexota bacterium]